MLWSGSLALFFKGFKVVSENAMYNAQSCLSTSLTRSISHSIHSQCKGQCALSKSSLNSAGRKGISFALSRACACRACVSALADSLQSCRAWMIVYSSVLPVLQLIPAHAFSCQGLWHHLGSVGTNRWWRTASMSLLTLGVFSLPTTVYSCERLPLVHTRKLFNVLYWTFAATLSCP